MTKATVNIQPEVDATVDSVASEVSKAAPNGPIFRRAGTLVRASEDNTSVATWGPEALRVEVSRYVRFVDNNRSVQPPKWLSRALLENPPQSFPPLEAISRTPLLLKDGSTILSGYHRPSGTLVANPTAVNASVQAPTVAQCTPMESAKVLLDPYREFPFDKAADRAALLSAILTVYCRHLIDGPIPAFAVNAPAAGTGKSLLVQLISRQTTGREVVAMLPVSGEEEMRKRLMANAIKAPQITLLDNLTEGLSSESLCSAITGGSITDRMLGSTQMVEASFRSVWFITGNRVSIEGDMRRRTLFINLDARQDNPHLRNFQLGQDKLEEDTARRHHVFALHAHNIIRGFWAANSPPHQFMPLGSFKAWDALVRSIVIWLSYPDPYRPIVHSREERFLLEWQKRYGTIAVPAVRVKADLFDYLPEKALTSMGACGKYLASLEREGSIERAGRGSQGMKWKLLAEQ